MQLLLTLYWLSELTWKPIVGQAMNVAVVSFYRSQTDRLFAIKLTEQSPQTGDVLQYDGVSVQENTSRLLWEHFMEK